MSGSGGGGRRTRSDAYTGGTPTIGQFYDILGSQDNQGQDWTADNSLARLRGRGRRNPYTNQQQALYDWIIGVQPGAQAPREPTPFTPPPTIQSPFDINTPNPGPSLPINSTAGKGPGSTVPAQPWYNRPQRF